MEEPAVELRTVQNQQANNGEGPSVRSRTIVSPENSLPVDESRPRDRQEFSLPPVDGGKDAWLFLATCFTTEALVWGFPFAFGVFQDYFRIHEPFKGSTQTAVIGTCALGIMYFLGPIIMGLQRLQPYLLLRIPFLGAFVMSGALALSSFSTSTTHLILTQGLMYGIGGISIYIPALIYIDEWFIRRKGLAYGVMWSGTGLGGVLFPLLLEWLLGQYGFRTTLRIWAVVLFVVTAPLAWFLKPRIMPTRPTGCRPPGATWKRIRGMLDVWKERTFLLHQLANVIEAMGFFLPSIYLPSYARSTLGAGPFPSALTLILVNVANIFGTVAMGSLSDRLHATTCILISTVGAALGIFVLWGLASNLATLYAFCIVYGLFAGSYVSAWPGVMKQIREEVATRNAAEEGAQQEFNGSAGNSGRADVEYFDTVMVFGFLAAGRGVGNVLSGPLSEALIKGMPWKGMASGGYGSGYGTLIAFTGISATLGGASFVFRRIGWM